MTFWSLGFGIGKIMHRGLDESLIMDILFLILDNLRNFGRLIANECKIGLDILTNFF